VSLQQLLQQTSGLGDDHDGEDDERFTDVAAGDLAPGAWWIYSNRGSIVARRVLERMRTPAATEVGDVDYGWFTRLGDLDEHKGVGHSGNFEEGVSVMSLRFPADDLTIAVLMNGAPAPGMTAWDLATRVARVELGLPAPEVHEQPADLALFEKLAGRYDLHGIVATVRVRDGRLWLEVPGWEGALLYAGGTRFLGGPLGVDPDRATEFIVTGNVVRGAKVGHRFMLDGVARRLGPLDGTPEAR
jgi:hypothetical protein